jgi:OPT oligopeptide transporter protein
MDTRHYGSELESADSIPLQTRHNFSSSADEAADASSHTSSDEAEVHPDSDAAFLRRHRAYTAPASDDALTLDLPNTLFDRLLRFIMSKTPLLTRASPALGNGSYGAMPVTHSPQSSRSSQASGDESDDVRRRDKRKGSAVPRSASRLEPSTSAPSLPRQQSSKPRRRGRTSSQVSELGMGLESKASYAGGGPLLRGSLDELDGHSTSSSATQSTDRSSKSGRRRDIGEDPIDNSPYPQVRASVPATDDPTLSISTPRMWTLSLLFAVAGSATNLFFSLRYPSVAITPVIALVLVHPLGKLWDILFKHHDDPDEVFLDGIRQSLEPDTHSAARRIRLWLAQGRWNEKEHACVYISSNVSFGFAFATDVIVEQHKFYKQDVPILYQILLTISTQILGYAFAGLTRRYLVRPAAMIWPGTLMSTAMFTTMHKQDNEPANGWTISRYRFFIYVWTGAFTWYFLPGLLFPALSYFNVITWFAPKNVVIANLVRQLSTYQFIRLTSLVRRRIWPWIISLDIRLGADCIYWISPPDALVGCRQCCRWSGACDVDHRPFIVYEKTIPCS